MFSSFDPTVQAALWGALAAAAIKLVDVALGRGDRARSARDELRRDLELQIKRRQDAEAEADRLHALAHELRTQLEDAEGAARLNQELADRVRRLQCDRERDLATICLVCALENSRLRDDNALLRRELRRLTTGTR